MLVISLGYKGCFLNDNAYLCAKPIILARNFVNIKRYSGDIYLDDEGLKDNKTVIYRD
jgi:hypothetical protein